MKISELIKALEAIKEDEGDLEVVISIDEEGNGFGKVSGNSYSFGVDDWMEEDEKSLAIFPC